ncbi:hypothetical protein VRU48_16440 [Pedobacter sp. KR3-3]|uniref:Uncharacterized protein n=1 Tax=Pedobacter albus TaxID=3113905 RepID=A0ABU7IB49_9SPHI|nr:hypothetical protein [Pedobacter sp. KR3-3]MEE1946715.1 hypothetical protein [Pedobacter sp. KR3-3]
MENKDITIDYNSHLAINFPDKSFRLSAQMLRKALDFYSSEKLEDDTLVIIPIESSDFEEFNSD